MRGPSRNPLRSPRLLSRSDRNSDSISASAVSACGAASGCSDRGHAAISQLKRGDVDWDALFAGGVRWFHTGGIFAALSETTPEVAREAMEAARRHNVIVSYDLNYRPSLWKGIGGAEKARAVNRQL